MKIIKIIKKYIPENIKYEIKYLFKYKKILSFLKYNSQYHEEYLYLKKNKFNVFPYEFTKRYSWKSISIQKDENNRFFYLYKGKKMYFKKSMKKEEIMKYVNSILLEQDEHSPHNYNLDVVKNNKNIKVIADIGAAEGFLTLELIDKIDKAYLFECDTEWGEALQQTFKNYKDKVEIVNKFLGKDNNNETITLDMFFQNKKIDFIKADIEGSEIDMCLGGEKTFQKLYNIAICTYHKHNDAEILKKILLNFKFKVRFTKGYMIFLYDNNLKKPYLRHGVILGYKDIIL